MATSPIECTASRSNTGAQEMPLSDERYLPPVELAT
jgi:hypothetical protein